MEWCEQSLISLIILTSSPRGSPGLPSRIIVGSDKVPPLTVTGQFIPQAGRGNLLLFLLEDFESVACWENNVKSLKFHQHHKGLPENGLWFIPPA